jgi:hypothetical protein
MLQENPDVLDPNDFGLEELLQLGAVEGIGERNARTDGSKPAP